VKPDARQTRQTLAPDIERHCLPMRTFLLPDCVSYYAIWALPKGYAAVTVSFQGRHRRNLNLHPKENKAKPYQVKQVRLVILQYGLGGREDE
jgi:hypothetical protein